MDKITKQAIIWFLVILFGGGLLSLALGQGFWGEKAPQNIQTEPPKPDENGWIWGSSGPNMNEKCDASKDCKDCHPDKYE